MPVVHLFESPERFVAGTVGEPGQRTFFLQAREGQRITSVALEKEQVAVLAERVDDLLDELVRVSGGDSRVPAVAPQELVDGEPLEQPIEQEFRVGTMTLAWDGEAEHVVLEIFSLEESAEEEETQDDETEAEEVLQVHLSATAARVFAKRALSVVSAGRPPCPFCGNPLDQGGHICPRANGFRRLS
ncbi:MAG TPA: DUF3090 domain-containing protein [Nocardioidaceae bacterium]|nr:DUF3090 domain-containing protein [Nocardioidaceae bacterium]